MEKLNEYIDLLIQLSIEYAPKVLLAVIVLSIGWWIAKRISNILGEKLQQTSSLEKSVQGFLCSIAELGMKVLVVISVAGIVGIETTSFVGIIAAMGFAVGLALQGNLSNFAAGVMILLNRPYKVGDEVKVDKSWGFVHEIKIFHTVIRNFDRTLTTIPNSKVIGGAIRNMSASPIRRIAIELNIPYTEDFNKAKSVLVEAVANVPNITDERPVRFNIKEFSDHFIRVKIVSFAALKGFWGTERNVKETIVNTLVKHNIKVAYPTGITFGEHGKPEVEVGELAVH